MSKKRLVEKLQRFGIQLEGIRTYCSKNEQDHDKFHTKQYNYLKFYVKISFFFIQIGLVKQKEFLSEVTSRRK